MKLCVLIPCYNEELGIANVIQGIPIKRLDALGYTTKVLVVDNNSNDNTKEIAAANGAEVIQEKMQGKGYAIITGFRHLPKDTDIVVMIEGDDSYLSSEMLRIIEPLYNDFCQVVIGTRLGGKMSRDAMSFFNRIGNWYFTFLVRLLYHGNVTDVCSGYFGWKKEVIDCLLPYLTSDGFAIEMEMITKMARMNQEIYCVPITYRRRNGHSSLRPLKDGLKIMKTWYTNLTWSFDNHEIQSYSEDSVKA